MELTAFAMWLNTVFAAFDHVILSFFHTAAVHANTVLTPLMDFLSLIGDNGYFCFALAAVLLCFPKTRRIGVCILIAIACGALLTNVTIKNLVARPRPFQNGYADWWVFVGAPAEGEFSFPSGHVTAAMACMTAVCLHLQKKWRLLILPAALYVLMMAAARNYLMVHYPTDVIGGMLVGGVAGTVAYFLTRSLFEWLMKHKEHPVCRFFATDEIEK